MKRDRNQEGYAMPTFVMLTQISPDALSSPQSLEVLERRAMERIGKECPEVQWVASYATLGPYDYLDVFRAPDIETATKIATLIRVWGRAHTEIWAAVPWEGFKHMVSRLSAVTEEPAGAAALA
jgi:uncharacterized protein with GYD domain